jgi:hypothetical protein
MPEIQRAMKRVFKNDFDDFMDAATGPGAGSVNSDILEISFCKAHFCPDHGGIFTMNLKDGKSAGAIYSEKAVTVHVGDCDGAETLPQPIREWLEYNSNFLGNKEIRYGR